jgi:hypothetical protein
MQCWAKQWRTSGEVAWPKKGLLFWIVFFGFSGAVG